MTVALSVEDVEYIAHKLAKEWMSWDEPIPDFSCRYQHRLESCLLTPFQTFGKKQLYKGLLKQASILFYLMIKNHPFQNGNKRIAVTTLTVLLYRNKKWIKVDNQELYNFAVWVASSPPKLKEQTVLAIHEFLRRHVVDMKNK